MPAIALPFLLAAAAFVAAAPSAVRAADACMIEAEEAHPLADRADLLAEYQQLPRHCLEAIFRDCTVAAGRTLLDLGTAAMCSLSYEALLRQGFNGNFHALMAWWRSDQETTPR